MQTETIDKLYLEWSQCTRARTSRELALVKALNGLLERYTGLVNCGDCGFWDPEKEENVIAARSALALAVT